MISLEQLLVLVGIASASEVPVETFNVTEEYNLQENTQLYYINPDELTCLADNIYFEARNQGTAGWQAVAALPISKRRQKCSWMRRRRQRQRGQNARLC